MNTELEPRMNTDGPGFDGPHALLTREIIGAAMEVANTLGHGLLEKYYENAPVVELRTRGVEVQQQSRLEVIYKNTSVGDFVPDPIVGGPCHLDAKTIEQLGATERGRMINHRRITRLTVGLTINFKDSKSTWDRVLL
jgi:GxxExxY protein